MTTITTKQDLCTMISELINFAPDLTVKTLTEGSTNITEAVVQVLTIGANKLNKQRPHAWFTKYATNFENVPHTALTELEGYLEARVGLNGENFKNRLTQMPIETVEKLKLEVEKMVWLVAYKGQANRKHSQHQYWESISMMISEELQSR